MLITMLPDALGPASKEAVEGRHQYQEIVLENIFVELKVLEASLVADVDAQQQLARGGDSERATRVAAEAVAKEAVEAKTLSAAETKTILNAARDAAVQAKAK